MKLVEVTQGTDTLVDMSKEMWIGEIKMVHYFEAKWWEALDMLCYASPTGPLKLKLCVTGTLPLCTCCVGASWSDVPLRGHILSSSALGRSLGHVILASSASGDANSGLL